MVSAFILCCVVNLWNREDETVLHRKGIKAPLL